MNPQNPRLYYFLLAVLAMSTLVEIGLQTFWQNKYGAYISPVVWMGAGVVSCLAALWMIGFRTSPIPAWPKPSLPISRYALAMGLFLSGAIFCALRLQDVFSEFEVAAKNSDIIPSLQLYVQRWLGGEKVYQPMVFDGWTVLPTYFPLLWMPYAFSEILQIDYRWTAYVVFLIAILLYQIWLVRRDVPWWELVIKSLIPFLFIYYFVQYARGTLGFAVELLPVGFYLILSFSILRKNKLFLALGIVLCLLSRYAFTFWLPVFLLVYWIENGFKNVLRVGLYSLVGVLLVYVLPFLVKDPTILTNGLKYYGKTAEGQWETQYWQEPGDVPHHLNKGFGMAMYFYDDIELTVPDRLKRNRKYHLAVCGFVAVLLLGGYFLFRSRGLNVPIYFLIGLKLYLVFFYGFFYVPFSYLYKLPLFLSLAIWYLIPFRPRFSH